MVHKEFHNQGSRILEKQIDEGKFKNEYHRTGRMVRSRTETNNSNVLTRFQKQISNDTINTTIVHLK